MASHPRLPAFIKAARGADGSPSLSLASRTVRMALVVLAALALPALARALGLWCGAHSRGGGALALLPAAHVAAPAPAPEESAATARTLAELSASADLLAREAKGMSELMADSFEALRALRSRLEALNSEVASASAAVGEVQAELQRGEGLALRPRAPQPVPSPMEFPSKPDGFTSTLDAPKTEGGALAPRGRAAAAAPLVDLSTTEEKVFSQNGEDGVITAIFKAVGTHTKFYVEFGTETVGVGTDFGGWARLCACCR